MPTDYKDLNTAYEEDWQLLQKPIPKEKEKPNLATERDDYFRKYRTFVVLLWLALNGILVAVVSSFQLANAIAPDETKTNSQYYLSANFYVSSRFFVTLLFIVAGLGAVRLVGATIYQFQALFLRGR